MRVAQFQLRLSAVQTATALSQDVTIFEACAGLLEGYVPLNNYAFASCGKVVFRRLLREMWLAGMSRASLRSSVCGSLGRGPRAQERAEERLHPESTWEGLHGR